VLAFALTGQGVNDTGEAQRVSPAQQPRAVRLPPEWVLPGPSLHMPGQMLAGLVVDATGRAARTPAWLSQIGYDPPAEDRVRVDILYVTRHLRLRPGALGESKLVLIGAEPTRPTALLLAAQEGGRWILTLVGYAGHHPPTDPDGFVAFARGFASAHVSAAIADADPLDDTAPAGSGPGAAVLPGRRHAGEPDLAADQAVRKASRMRHIPVFLALDCPGSRPPTRAALRLRRMRSASPPLDPATAHLRSAATRMTGRTGQA